MYKTFVKQSECTSFTDCLIAKRKLYEDVHNRSTGKLFFQSEIKFILPSRKFSLKVQ